MPIVSSSIIWGYVVCIGAGLLIELFFKLVRYRDDLNSHGPVSKYRPINYMTVTEYISGGNRKWFKYVCFRSLPPFIVLTLLASILTTYFPKQNVLISLLLASLISIVLRDGKSLFNNKITTAEKLIHLLNILVVMIVVVIVYLITSIFSLTWLAPSLSGIVDNLWSSLFVAILVVLYLDATNITGEYHSDRGEVTARNNYIVKTYAEIRDKYEDEINKVILKNKTSKPLLYAILIYESMNRPKFLRFLENRIVALTGKELTVGIAQVKSAKALSDIESIIIGANILKNTNDLELRSPPITSNASVTKAVKKYNLDPNYCENIELILDSLRIYAPTIFSKE